MNQIRTEVSIVIPTYQRDKVLLDTVSALLNLPIQPGQLFIIDQTKNHQPETLSQLTRWKSEGVISWQVLTAPSITAAMNIGLQMAKTPLVLFLDDDIIPHPHLVEKHWSAHHADPSLWATVGQIIQPWQESLAISPPRQFSGLMRDYDFPFNSSLDTEVHNTMATNLCVNRQRALSIGGFDERFIGAAYRFETEFARRIEKAGGKIMFAGSAGINHLRVQSGGTRSSGSHMTSASPKHGFGDHYYAFLHGKGLESWTYCFKRIFREGRTKFHLTHPWWIPVKLVGEIRALFLARKMIKQGPKLIGMDETA